MGSKKTRTINSFFVFVTSLYCLTQQRKRLLPIATRKHEHNTKRRFGQKVPMPESTGSPSLVCERHNFDILCVRVQLPWLELNSYKMYVNIMTLAYWAWVTCAENYNSNGNIFFQLLLRDLGEKNDLAGCKKEKNRAEQQNKSITFHWVAFDTKTKLNLTSV